VISGILTSRKRRSSGTQIAKATAFADRPAGERPLHRADDRGERDPHRDRGEATNDGALALRQHDIGQGEEDGRGVDRQARQRALGDERRIVVEREEHVRGAGRNRQGGDQGADHRTRALGDDGCRHHERGSDRHAQRERQDESEIGGHFLLLSSLRKQ
jgi:hypothetical protein